jgi:hypothetical protein
LTHFLTQVAGQIQLVTTTYQTGVKLTKEAMSILGTQLQRLPLLGKWFVKIGVGPEKCGRQSWSLAHHFFTRSSLTRLPVQK